MEAHMAHLINRFWHSNYFLTQTIPPKCPDFQKWNESIIRNAIKKQKVGFSSFIDDIKKAFSMEQLKFTINNTQERFKEGILAAMNPAIGSMHMKQMLETPSFWHHLSQSYNLPPYCLAESTASTLLGIDYPSCFQTTTIGTRLFPPFEHNKLQKEHTLIHEFSYVNEIYKKYGEDRLIDYNGEIRGLAHCYTNGSRHIFVFENRVSTEAGDYPCIGREPLPNYPFGHENLYTLPLLPCLIFNIPDVCFEFRQIYLEAGKVASSRFHALTCYDNVKNMSFSELSGRDIILICSPDRPEWDDLNDVLKICSKSGVKSVAIYPYPIIGEYCHSGTRLLSEESRELLYRKVVDLNECERVTKLAKHIISQAIPQAELAHFKKEYKLDKDVSDTSIPDEGEFEFQSWRELDNGNIDISEPITTGKFFSSANITLIYGESDTGKSWFSLQVAIAKATGRNVFGLSASSPTKVFYLDGEIGSDFTTRVRQLTKGFTQHEMDLLDKNLKVRSFTESKDLLEHRELLLNVLKKGEAGAVVIDNILSLAPQSWRGKSDSLFDFLRQIKSMKIAPLIVHHTGKSGDTYLGSVSLGSLSQNIIKLTKARGTTCEIQKTTDLRLCESIDTFAEAESDKGPFVHVCLEKTKVAPYWLNESIYVWLPTGQSWRQLTEWPEIPSVIPNNPETDDAQDAQLGKAIMNFPPDERMAMQFIFPKKGGIKRKELDAQFGWEEQKSVDILNSLKDKGFVISEGEGKGRIYKPKDV